MRGGASSRFKGASWHFCLWPSVYMLMSRRLPGSRLFLIPSSPAASHGRLQEIRIGGAVRERIRTARHRGSGSCGCDCARIGHAVGRPWSPPTGSRCIDALYEFTTGC